MKRIITSLLSETASSTPFFSLLDGLLTLTWLVFSAGQYDVFLASPAVIKLIPRLLGPGLNKAGKFPTLIDHKTPITDKVEQMKSTIKFQLKKVICMNVAVGHVKMKPDELDLNIRLAVNFLVSLLKKNWQNIKCLYIKSSMGRPFRIY